MAAAADSDYFTKQINAAKVEVRTHFSALIDKLRQREVQLLNELDVIEKDHHQKDKEMFESFKQIMLDVKPNTDICTELTEQLAKYDPHAKVKSVQFVCSSEWEKQISRMGQISVNRGTNPIKYNSKLGPQISVRRGRAKEEGQDAKTHHYSGVAIDPSTNNIYLADYINSSVSVYNDTGVYLFEFGSDNNKNVRNDCKMSGPTCIVFYNDTLFISQTRSHCILVYKMDGTLISKFGSHGSNYGQLNSPLGFAICSNTGDIYVCDSSNNRVAVFNSDFKHEENMSCTLIAIESPQYMKQNTTHTFISRQSLKSPRDVKLTKNTIMILDSNKKCVHVYNLSNKQCTHSFISCGENNCYIKSASFLAIDKDDNIIISDSGTDSVYIFTSEGKLFHQIGGGNTYQLFGGNTDHLSKPVGVAIDNKNRLVKVNNKKDAIIQIY